MCMVKRFEEMEKKMYLTTKDGSIIDAGSVNIYKDKNECWDRVFEFLDDADNLEITDIASLHCELMNEDEDTVYLTKHALERMRERNGWNEKTSFRMAVKIHDKGIDLAKETLGYLSKWARRKKEKSPECDYIMYGNYVYVFAGNVLLTSEVPPTRESVLRSFRHLKTTPRTKERKILQEA